MGLMTMTVVVGASCAGTGGAGTAGAGTLSADEHHSVVYGNAADRELGRSMRKVPIAMYMTTWCSVCTRARAWLEANGYRVALYDVEAEPNASRVHILLNPRGSVPTFDVDGVTVVGFAPAQFEAVVARVAIRNAAASGTMAVPRPAHR